MLKPCARGLIRVSVKRGPDTYGWRMWVGKCGWENADRKVRMKKKNGKKIKKKILKIIIKTIIKTTLKEEMMTYTAAKAKN